MLFVEFRFLVFFLVVFGVYWSLRGNSARKCWLLLCNYVFYSGFFIGDPEIFFEHVIQGQWGQLPAGWWFPTVLAASTCMDFAVGLGIGGASTDARRKAWLLVSLVVNVGVLSFFKYFNFFVSSASGFLEWFGLHTSLHTLQIILPYGVSFYTFQSMSYSIDVYRRRLEPVRRFLDLAFFISFFPQLVAGPIVRATIFLPQVFEKRRWADVDARGSVALFFVGFVKKACVSEFASQISDPFFAAPGKYSHTGALIAILFYSVQIYCDFSGYTDMAIATARLLGYELTLNFDFPFFSRSVSEFWRRWHISLSTWLRDYIYIPLGGNRGTKLFVWRNLLLTMLIGGLWHGAAWHYVVMGGLNGLALIIHREWAQLTENTGAIFNRVRSVLAYPLTCYWTLVTFIFFRAQAVYNAKTHALEATAMENACAVLKTISFIGRQGKLNLNLKCVAVLAVLAVVHWLNFHRVLGTQWRRLPDWACAALLALGSVIALLFVPVKYKPFVYFQF
ncbi:MAG TPA: MBOAT family O-acyltransferase [Chthoniobacter sp.]|jgi:alginate O-acetyltransferase complex protein AlgI